MSTVSVPGPICIKNAVAAVAVAKFPARIVRPSGNEGRKMTFFEPVVVNPVWSVQENTVPLLPSRVKLPFVPNANVLAEVLPEKVYEEVPIAKSFKLIVPCVCVIPSGASAF
jgi:hypothetical protein